MPKTTKKKTTQKTGAKREPAKKTAKPKARDAKPMSLTDHALAILGKAKDHMNARDICAAALKAGWPGKGATPHATLDSAMLRDDRFERADRGLWQLKKGGRK